MKTKMRMLLRTTGPLLFAMGACLLLTSGCGTETPVGPEDHIGVVDDNSQLPGRDPRGPANRITGGVEIIFQGGNGNDPNEDDGYKRAFVNIVGHEPTADRPGHGSLKYTVADASGEVHRRIVVELEGIRLATGSAKVFYRGVVVSDTKGCSGGSNGGHAPGCPGGDCGDDHEHIPGGCSGTDGSCGSDHDHIDGGCSGTDGGCSSDHDHVDGGCSGTDGSCGSDHDHVDGGCSGSDGHDGGHDGGCSGSGGSCGGHDGDSGGAANKVNGRSCRVGQILAGKAHDGGSPATAGDGITWKWFDPDDPSLPSLDDITAWRHLCKKTILAGNLVVHGRKPYTPVAKRMPM